GIDLYQVFPQATLYEMCEKLPSNLRLLKKIKGIGKVRLRMYGEDIVKMVRQYCNDNNIEIPDDDPEPYVLKKPPITSTYQITLELFKTGKKPIDIAKERNLA
ncbi:HRDC domain-containing protein, partial [Arthrospira platensis SPKY1]|nr:HRDC domain-containing protein [Arthrospira platensis SPKY1]